MTQANTHNRPRTRQRMQYVVSQPPANWQLSREAWDGLGAALKQDIARLNYELKNGAAIAKDRCCGRGKDDPEGFHGLHAKEYQLASLVAEGKADPDLSKAVDAMRERLKADDDRLNAIDELNDTFGPMAAQHGLTLPEYIEFFVNIEKDLGAAFEAWDDGRDAGPLLGVFIRASEFTGGNGAADVFDALRNYSQKETEH